MIFAFSLGFLARHPGLLLVLVGVAGEVLFDWPEMKGKRVWGKRLSAIILVLGLVLEFVEAAKSDNEVTATKERTAHAERQAGQANERAAIIESNSIALSLTIEGFRSNNLAVENQVEELRKENLLLQTKMINGLYSRTVEEVFRINESSRVTVQDLGMNNTRIFFKLQNVPIPNSLQAIEQSHPGIIRGLLGLIIGSPFTKQMPVGVVSYKNVAFTELGMAKWDTLEYPNDAVFILKYTKMEQETNLFKKVVIKGKDVFFDNEKEVFQ